MWAPPGRYTVELAVDGRKLTRPLTVVPDPRVQLAPAAYRRQFELARRVEKARAALAAAQGEAAAAHKILQKRAPDPDAAALDAELQAVAEIADPDPRAMRGPPKSLASFPFLDGALGKLAAAVDGADVDPSPDARAGLEHTEKTLAATLAAWEKLRPRLPR